MVRGRDRASPRCNRSRVCRALKKRPRAARRVPVRDAKARAIVPSEYQGPTLVLPRSDLGMTYLPLQALEKAAARGFSHVRVSQDWEKRRRTAHAVSPANR